VAVTPDPLAILSFNSSNSRSLSLSCAMTLRVLATNSEGPTFKSSESSLTSVSSFFIMAMAPLPVWASIRLTPAATPVSETILNSPISPVCLQCVPPHSSLLNDSTVTTRTSSPYLSPKKANAPFATAS
jgi:hypothetical protein